MLILAYIGTTSIFLSILIFIVGVIIGNIDGVPIKFDRIVMGVAMALLALGAVAFLTTAFISIISGLPATLS